MKNVALYDPYLDTLGGGELHILSILQVLDSLGFKISVFWDKNLTHQIKEKFSLQFINELKYLPNIFKNKSFPSSILKILRTLRNFDYFFYVTDGSYFFSSAKKNYVFCMVPDKKLYQSNFLNRLKILNYQFVTNSQFTGNRLTKWGIKNQILYPYISDIFFRKSAIKKEKIILSVGRFFPHLHSKQHEVMINVHKKFTRSRTNLIPYRLILAGGLKKEDEEYFLKLKKIVGNNPSIELKPNVTFKELMSLYQKAEIFWHFTGYGVDENVFPNKVEHLGITPLEAMASGCITFCYKAGGPKEFIEDGKNGFLFDTEEKLIKTTIAVMNNQLVRQTIIRNAIQTVKNNFSYNVFKEQVKKIIL